MPKGVFKLPNITNEPIKSYAPGSPERKELKSQKKKNKRQKSINCVLSLPMFQ